VSLAVAVSQWQLQLSKNKESREEQNQSIKKRSNPPCLFVSLSPWSLKRMQQNARKMMIFCEFVPFPANLDNSIRKLREGLERGTTNPSSSANAYFLLCFFQNASPSLNLARNSTK
jgi:hypothetical protein